MTRYVYQGREYHDLMSLRDYHRGIILPRNPDHDLLENLGIRVEEVLATDESGELAKRELEIRLARADEQTSEAILAGFDYVVDGENNGEKLHFSYDSFDQQNFADTANACLLQAAGVPGLPATVVWNGWKEDGTMHALTLSAGQFLDLYVNGALAHKQTCMARNRALKEAILQEANEGEEPLTAVVVEQTKVDAGGEEAETGAEEAGTEAVAQTEPEPEIEPEIEPGVAEEPGAGA